MKKYILPTLLFLFFSSPSFAQVGIKGGLNLSSLYAEDGIIEDKQATLGFQGGLVFSLPVNEVLAIQPEAIYTRRGASFVFEPTEIDARFDYVDVPVLLVFKPRLLQFFRLHAGPQFSYLADVEYEFRFDDGDTEIDSNKDNYNEWDIGMAVGATAHIDQLFIELRYTQGFRSVDKPREILGVEFGEHNLRNFGLQLSAGVFF